MRCKPGDLAIVVGGSNNNIGMTVTVHNLEDPPIPLFLGDPPREVKIEKSGEIWRVNRNIHWFTAISLQPIYEGPYIEDRCLLPISPPADMKEDVGEQELNVIR